MIDPSTRNVRGRYRTLAERVTAQLLEDVVGSRFEPGQRLKGPGLAELYGVIGGPVREAIRVLSGRGLVEVVSSVGTLSPHCLQTSSQTYMR